MKEHAIVELLVDKISAPKGSIGTVVHMSDTYPMCLVEFVISEKSYVISLNFNEVKEKT